MEELEILFKCDFIEHAFPSHQWDPRAEDTARREEDSTADNSIYRSLATCTTTEGDAACATEGTERVKQRRVSATRVADLTGNPEGNMSFIPSAFDWEMVRFTDLIIS